jgi:hypothetical protein
MSERVDELFGSAGTEARPRTALIVSLTVGGFLLTVGGLACSVIPGALLVLAAWIVVQRELDRVESGFLPVTERSSLLALRAIVWIAVGLVALLTVLQLAGLWTGVYSVFWGGLVQAWVEQHPNAAPPPP